MPIVRKFTNFSLEWAAVQLLVDLALEGHLDNYDMPWWATHTSMEELVKTLRYLNDPAWKKILDAKLSQDEAEEWLTAWGDGKEVMTIEEWFTAWGDGEE